MTWTYQNQIITTLPDDCVGFVYLITNLSNNRMYVGKKLARFQKTTYRMHTQRNGIKKRRAQRTQVDSDWPTYYGSSRELSADVERLGQHCFIREILYFCRSKSECSYIEAREQFSRRVLESDQYYNGNIQVRIHKNHILNKI